MTASKNIPTCLRESPAAMWCSGLRQTASYSTARATLSNIVAFSCLAARTIAAEACWTTHGGDHDRCHTEKEVAPISESQFMSGRPLAYTRSCECFHDGCINAGSGVS